MADIQLSRPAANQTQTVTSAADARFVFNFATGDAKLAKSGNGENLILTFDDGAKIEVEGFYTTFNKDNLPTLNVGGQDISGEQLAAVLGEDLMPAAGPAAQSAAQQGGRFRSFADADLNGGLDRLNGLDIGFTDNVQLYDSPDGYYALADATTATSGEIEPAPTPAPTPTPNPTPQDFLKAQDDAYTGGIMNSFTLANLVGNDTLGTIDADSVRDHTITSDKTWGGKVEMVGNDLTLTLNGKALEDALYESGAAGEIIKGAVNTAAKVKPVGGGLEVDYTAQDATGEYTGTATASITVGDNAETMLGGDGKDVAWVAGNTGRIETGNGQDIVVAQSNSGVIDGGAGSDSLYVGSSDGIVDGAEGNDKINISGTNSGTVFGGSGNDTITVYENAGKISGGAGNDTIDVVEGSGDNSVEGGAGRDLLVLRGGSSYMDGGADNDTLKVQGDDDEHIWNRNWDSVKGTWNKASLAQAEQNDAQYATLVGGAGEDKLQASDASHHNQLYGDGLDYGTPEGSKDVVEVFNLSHDNTAHGGGGGDEIRIFRYAHHNDVYGDAGSDTLQAYNQAQDNTLHGGADNDVLQVYGSNDNPATEYDAENNARVWGNPTGNVLYGDEGNDKLTAGGTVNTDSRTGLRHNDGALDNLLDGGTGNDTLITEGSAYRNELFGGTGNDVLKAAKTSADNVLVGGQGNDTLSTVDQASGNTLRGGTGVDLLVDNTQGRSMSASALAEWTGNTFNGGAGNDVLAAGWNALKSNLDGGTGDDLFIMSNTDTSNHFDGGAGSNLMLSTINRDASDFAGMDISNMDVIVNKGAKELLTNGALDSGSSNIFNDPARYAAADVWGKVQQALADKGATWKDGSFTYDPALWVDNGKSVTLNGVEYTEMRYKGSETIRILVSEKAVPHGTAGGLEFTGDASGNKYTSYAADAYLAGEGGNDSLFASSANATNNDLYGGAGNDSMGASKGASANYVYGGEGNDKLFVTEDAHHNILRGGAGNDILLAQSGGHDNTLYGGAGNDQLLVRGDAHHNTLYGDTGKDQLYVRDTAHDNTLHGGEGNDTLVAEGEAWGNLFYGDGGLDTLVARGDAHHNTMHGSDDIDRLSVDGSAHENELYGYGGADTIIADGDAWGNALYGGDGNDLLIARGNAHGNTLDGGDGVGNRLLLDGTAHNNKMLGGDGTDAFTVKGSGGGNTLDGGAGNDLFNLVQANDPSSDTIIGGDGLDVLLAPTNTSLDELLAHVTGVEAIVIKGAETHFDTMQPADPTQPAQQMSLSSVRKALGDLGVKWNGEDKLTFAKSAGWEQGEEQTFHGQSYCEMHNDQADVSILVATNSLTFNQG